MPALILVTAFLIICGSAVVAQVRPVGWDAAFWTSWSIGLAAAGISAAVWVMRPNELATRLFLLVGLTFMASLMAIAICGYDRPPVPSGVAHIAAQINLIANQLFNFALVCLFLQYPLKLVRTRWIWATLALIVPFAAAILRVDEAIVHRWAPYMQIQLVVVIGLIIWQWIATRRAPRDRAALMWLALSVLTGSALWVVLLVTDIARGGGGRATSGIVALVLFFPFYIGLAMGVARFCLIELQDWTFRILFFIMAALLFVAIDAALVMVLGLNGNPALGLSLFIVAFAYLPLREFVWRRFTHGRQLSQSDMFAAVMEIVFAPTPHDRGRRWQGLVRDLFRPLDLSAGEAVDMPAITDGGLRLVLPAAADGPPLVLSYAREGRGLFTPSQLALSRRLIDLIGTASLSRDAYARGAAEERLRLAQDLHDDVGARLLSGLTVADAQTRPLLQAALGDIRVIANGLAGKEAPLDRVLADTRHECVRRFEAAGIEVSWPLWPDRAPLILLDYRLQKALGSGLRETVSNIIRHAGATMVGVDIQVEDNRLKMTVCDNGKGLREDVLSGEQAGHGLKGLVRRLADIGGQARYANRSDGQPGTQVDLVLPLRL